VAFAKGRGLTLEEVERNRIAAIPARRVGTPAEFGAICAFLCSAQAGYLVAQNVLVDGGAYPGTF
jgi:3-oxoacyl-[acyl-carrier protein] reductase